MISLHFYSVVTMLVIRAEHNCMLQCRSIKFEIEKRSYSFCITDYVISPKILLSILSILHIQYTVYISLYFTHIMCHLRF